ncbi:MAG: hypothetical protein HLUCCX14_15820 [Marinobacter excellens HL-55]|uniref:Uncharacterized protein n=1 Tax=Marinobacter excellens HL-55 TaxID=1305731 RepID=A0A0N8KK59_9GAMM|nr:MAG: hypothetical protein HLUCCX14_15820 [Marinobacter excellens HL-55]
MSQTEHALTNHEVTVCLAGGAVRELVREYDAFLQGEKQRRYKFHLHDTYTNTVHTLILNFEQVTGICDHVRLRSQERGA